MPPKVREVAPRQDLQCGQFRHVSHHQRRREQLEAGHKAEQRNGRSFGGNGTAECDANNDPRGNAADHPGTGTASAVVAIGTLRRRNYDRGHRRSKRHRHGVLGASCRKRVN
jgi:hypothetical protein